MSENLGEFFSLIGKAKKEKEDEFRSLVGDLDIDSMFSQVKESIKEDKKKKKKEEKQIKALESWLFTETQLQEKTEEVSKSPIVGVDETEYEKWIEDEWDEEEEVTSEVVEETEEDEVEDTVDHALKILETIKSKEEVRENLQDPEILKIRRELEYLKNLVNAQGGGGEVRLEFLDDVDRDTAKVNGKFLKYQSSTGKWIGADASGGEASEEASKLVLDARNNNVGYAITIGTPVYQTGYNSGQDRINIEGARASDPSTMPAKGVTITDLDNNTNGQILVYGELEGVDTSAFDVADELFVAPDGGLTNTRPTDPGHLVQKIAVVLKKSASNGAILVYGAGRTNDVPNSISVAGIITASSFDGDLTGNADTATYASSAGIATYATSAGIATYATSAGIATYATSAGIATYATTAGVATEAQGLTGSPDIVIQNITGVAATFTGDLTIEGTLSYEDITNVDSIGFATFRKGIEVQGAGSTTTTLNVTGVSTFSGDVNFAGDINGNVTIVSTDSGSSAAPELTLYRNSASPAPADYLGQIMFKGENSNGGEENYAKITGKIRDETLGTEDGMIETAIKGDGSFTIVSRQRHDELQLINGCGLSVDGDISGDLTGNVTGDVNAGIVTSSTVVLTNGLITTVSSTTTATDQTSIDSFSASTYRSAKYNVQITRGSEYQTTEISVIHDGSDSYGTEYATIKTGTSLATFSTDVSGGNVRLLATPSSATSTVFKLFRTTTEA